MSSLVPAHPGQKLTSTEDMQSRLAWQRAELNILQHVRLALTETGEMPEIIGRTVNALVDLLGYTHVGAYLVRDGELHLVHQVGYENPMEHLSLARGICGRVATTGKAVWLADVRSDPGYVAANLDVASEICAPFGALGETRGVLNVESTARAPLSMRDFRLIQEVVDLLSIALDRAELAIAHTTVEQRLQAALDAASMGVWTWTLTSGEWEWTFGENRDDAVRILSEIKSNGDMVSSVHAGDVAHVQHALYLAMVDGDLDVDFRVPTTTGTELWINLRGHAIDTWSDGKPVRAAGVAIDVSGRKRLEQERLRLVHLETARINAEEAHRVMATTIERLTDGFVATDPDLRLSLINEPAAALLGKHRDELLGQSMLEGFAAFADEKSRKRLLDSAMAPLPSSFDVYDCELERFLDIHVFPGSGGVTIHLRDVTSLREAEYERLRVEARFRSLVQQASDLMLILDRKGVVTFCSPAIERILGYQPSEIVGQDRVELVHPVDRKRLLQAFLRVSRTPGLGGQIDLRLAHHDGSYRWIEVTPTNLLADPVIMGIVANCRDVTERHESEFNLWLAAEVSTVIGSSLDVDTMLDGLNRLLTTYAYDFCAVAIEVEPGRYPHYRAAHRKALGQPNPDFLLIGRGAIGLARRSREQGLAVTEFRSVSVTNQFDGGDSSPISAFLEYLKTNGIRTVAPALINIRGERRGALLAGMTRERAFDGVETALVDDIAHRVGLALENAQLYQQAQEAVEARDRFLSIAAHELRTPITSVTGYSEMLQKEISGRKDPDRVVRYVGRLNEAGERLAGLAEDLLDVSRIQGGQMTVRRGLVNITTLIHRIGHGLTEQEESTATRIQFELAVDLPPINGDEDRLEQVFSNLIGNALKYSPAESTILVKCWTGDSEIRASVEDHGIGVDARSLEAIFQPFGRATNAVDSEVPGLGLGLYISRTIVNRHGGRIWAESNGPGTGLKVTVALPVDRTTITAQESTDHVHIP